MRPRHDGTWSATQPGLPKLVALMVDADIQLLEAELAGLLVGVDHEG